MAIQFIQKGTPLSPYEFKVGEHVVYTPHGEKPQDGRVTSKNEHYVFVCFDWTGRGVACDPRDLRKVL